MLTVELCLPSQPVVIPESELRNGFSIGEWHVLPSRGIIHNGREEVTPQPKVFAILMALATRDGDLVTRDELIEEIWGGRATSDESIHRCLSILRAHLGDRSTPHEYVETLVRRGYRLCKPVRVHENANDDPLERPKPKTGMLGRSLLLPATALLVVVVLIVYSWPRDDGEHLLLPPRSIGILPFSDLSLDPDSDFLAYGFKQELVKTLLESKEFAVKSSLVDYDDDPVQIAEKLDVDAVLVGAIQQVGGEVKVSYEIIDGRNGMSISSGNVVGRLEDLFQLQENVAFLVRGELSSSTPTLVSDFRSPDADAYLQYVRGLYALDRRIEPGMLQTAIDYFQKAIRLDDDFGPSYLRLATAYALLPDNADVPIAETLDLAVSTVERGMQIDPTIREPSQAVLGFVRYKQKRWRESEKHFSDAARASIVDANAFHLYSRMLSSVGRLEEALRMAKAARELNPTSATSNSRIALIYTWMGRSADAEEYFVQSERYGATGSTHLLGYAIHLARQGHVDQAGDVIMEGLRHTGLSLNWVEPVVAARTDASLSDKALQAVDEAAAQGGLTPQLELVLRTTLGDLDTAMKVAWQLDQPREPFAMDVLWIPEMEPLRAHPDFLPLMTALGVSDYWDDAQCDWRDGSVSCAGDE